MSTTVKKEIAKLEKMKTNELQAKFAEVTGETTRSPNRIFLIRRINEAFQCKGEKAPAVGRMDGAKPSEDHEQESKEKLTMLDVPQLQARYQEVVGRSSGSTDKRYLVWKIREAQKGRIPVGPRKSAHREGVTFKVLPLRMESDLVDKLDKAWRHLGLKSRMELFRKSLQTYLAGAGENEVAALLATVEG